MHLPTNTLLHGGKYKIIEKIGQGGFGIAYKANHELLNRVVCIKEFYYSDLCERKTNSSDITIVSTSSEKIQLVNSFKKKFVKEAQRLAKFQHPNIVQVTDVFEENNTAYFVMEYLEGGSLEDKLENTKMTEKQTLDVILPILDALETIHKAKLLHLDIKPLNIMFRKDKTPVLIDFGISKYMVLAGSYTTTAPVGLSKGYAPLEQYGGDITDFSEATDIYSVCATIYRMVSGSVPPEPLQILSNGLKPLSSFQSKISENLDNSVYKGLSINKSDRHASVPAFIKCLKNLDQTATISKTNILSSTTGIVDASLLLNSNLYKYSYIFSYSDGLAEVKLNDKYGIIGKGGQEIVPCIYDYISDVGEEQMLVEMNGNYGFIDRNGNEITPCKYVDAKSFYEERACVKFNEKWGFINTDGKMVTRYKYDEVGNFSEGLARVMHNDRWGYIDKNGEEVIPCEYYDANDFSGGRAKVSYGGGIIFVDKTGNTIPKNYWLGRGGYLEAGDFSDGLARVKVSSKYVLSPKVWYWGFIDIDGNEVIPCKYDDVEDYGLGLAAVMKKNIITGKEKWGVINKHNDLIVPMIYEDSSDTYDAIVNLIDSVKIKNWRIKAFDSKGNLLVSDDLSENEDATDGYILVNGALFGYDDEEEVFVDRNGKLLAAGVYDLLRSFSNGKALVKRNNKYGFINTEGKEVIPCKYDDAWDFVEGVALVKLKRKFYIIDEHGNVISQ